VELLLQGQHFTTQY